MTRNRLFDDPAEVKQAPRDLHICEFGQNGVPLRLLEVSDKYFRIIILCRVPEDGIDGHPIGSLDKTSVSLAHE